MLHSIEVKFLSPTWTYIQLLLPSSEVECNSFAFSAQSQPIRSEPIELIAFLNETEGKLEKDVRSGKLQYFRNNRHLLWNKKWICLDSLFPTRILVIWAVEYIFCIFFYFVRDENAMMQSSIDSVCLSSKIIIIFRRAIYDSIIQLTWSYWLPCTNFSFGQFLIQGLG